MFQNKMIKKGRFVESTKIIIISKKKKQSKPFNLVFDTAMKIDFNLAGGDTVNLLRKHSLVNRINNTHERYLLNNHSN